MKQAPDWAFRARDLVVAVPALVVLSPVLALIGLAIRLDSAGPVIFRQVRVGRHGNMFRIHKFRTMRTDVVGPFVSGSDDPRVTRVGSVLRRTKLDELPQLFDVLTGNMSIVGPRPEVPQYASHWPPEYAGAIISVRPGITDPVSIELRDEASVLGDVRDPEAAYLERLLPEKAQQYAEYVRRRSLTGDLRIIWQTIVAVLRGW